MTAGSDWIRLGARRNLGAGPDDPELSALPRVRTRSCVRDVPSLLRSAVTSTLLAASALAQGAGPYFNVESPQRKPIAVARVAGHDYLVACNTPDNCIEIYDTHTIETDPLTNGFLLRVQTGAEPVSVVYNSALNKVYTCNFLGDSISVIALSVGGGGALSATLERTVAVGDEPSHIAFDPDNSHLFVTLGSDSSVRQLQTNMLNQVASLELFDSVAIPRKTIKEPCAILAHNGRLFVLNHRGGKDQQGQDPIRQIYDFDLWGRKFVDDNSRIALGDLGTTNFSMAFGQPPAPGTSGHLWVVGVDAQFHVRGEAAVKDTQFGFARSKIYRVSNIDTSPLVESRDLNAATGFGTQVSFAEAFSQPTDLALYEPGGSLQKIYIAGFNSDKLGVLSGALQAVPAVPLSWTFTKKKLFPSPGSSNPMAGPRGLAVKYANGPVGDRLYVLNRLDNAISVVNTTTDLVLKTFALRRDPTPQYVRSGRKFLYDARLSGNGIVSCASCHIDGRSDWLMWDLNNSPTAGPLFPPNLLDGATGAGPQTSLTNWPSNKSFLVTQTLQGMVNFQTAPETLDGARVQEYYSNEPLHWRADRADFLAFNPAFEALLGGAQLAPTDMQNFEKFVFSIAYPPNPEQPANREFSPVDASGVDAQRGLQLFHTNRVDAANVASGRSCVQCHALPEGSNNKIVLFITDSFSANNRQPLESAALRMLRQKESLLFRIPTPVVKTSMFGLFHQGDKGTIDGFITSGFGEVSPGDATDIAKFVRQLDTGVGPLVGQSHSIDMINLAAANALLDVWEGQAKLANNGVALQGRIAGVQRGFWYDAAKSGPTQRPYREDSNGFTYRRDMVLNLLTQATDVLVAHATPLGSERRFAWTGSGSPTPLSGSAPTSITLLPASPGTAYEDVPTYTDNWTPGSHSNGDFQWEPGPTGIPEPESLKAVRLFQYGLMTAGFLPELRHEAPRRFRVAMTDGRHGAKLVLKMADDPAAENPQQAIQFLTFELPLHATGDLFQGKPVWETAEEMEGLRLYTLMLGGPRAPGVQATLDDPESVPEPPGGNFYNPTVWNLFKVEVKNENGTTGSGGWQAITLD